MNPRKILTALILLCGMATCPTFAQKVWTLDDCVQYALDNNLQVKQSQVTAEQSAVDVKSSRAALFPSLTFNTNQQLGFQKVSSQDVATNVKGAKNPTYTGSYQLQAGVTLFDGGANWRTLQKSKLSQRAAQLDAEKTANNIEEQIIQAYYQVLYAHESVLTNEEIVAAAAKELERTQAYLSVGKGSKVDVAQMESQYQQNVYQLVTSRNTEAANLLQLKQLLQLETGDELTVDLTTPDDSEVLAPVMSVDEAQQAALNYLPDMKAAQAQVDVADYQVKIARGGYWPTISLNAGVGTSNGNTYSGDFTQQLEDHLNENIGLSLSVPIYDRRQTRSSVDRAKLSRVSAEYDLESTRLQVCNTIASLHLDILSAQSRYENAVVGEAAAKESFDLMEQRYTLGLENVVDLLTQKNNYLSAKQETLQSKYTALLNQRLMKFYTNQQ
jgi:outer membrane protein